MENTNFLFIDLSLKLPKNFSNKEKAYRLTLVFYEILPKYSNGFYLQLSLQNKSLNVMLMGPFLWVIDIKSILLAISTRKVHEHVCCIERFYAITIF